MSDDLSDDLSDETFDDTLREAARAYHAPPATPREAMWTRIAAARATARADAVPSRADAPPPELRVLSAPRDGAAGGAVLARTSVERSRRPIWALPLAAALLLGVGIGVGRMTVPSSPRNVSPDQRVATGVAPDVRAPAVAGAPPSASGETPAADAAGATAVASRGATNRASGRAGGADDALPGDRALSAAPLAYRLAAAQHLAHTETLLATLSADARAGRADSSVAAWARDLLGTTRVLLDSPAARDPQMARLLEDLELVLAQVAQLGAAPRGTEELQAIDRAVRGRDVMTRVRAAIPPGPLPAGT